VLAILHDDGGDATPAQQSMKHRSGFVVMEVDNDWRHLY
jgi:hypothetical protein